jgi:L-asparaginase/Glu-tRNA(Gln) amidotransferase subunit D
MSLAAFRKTEPHDDLAKLANEHMKHDLEPSDRDALLKATTRVTTSTTVGTLVGLGLGLYAAIKLRKIRTEMFAAFRAAEKPSYVVFANGRQGKFTG